MGDPEIREGHDQEKEREPSILPSARDILETEFYGNSAVSDCISNESEEFHLANLR